MIEVNGDSLEYHNSMTIRDILEIKNYRFPLLIIRINGILIPRNKYDSTTVPDKAVVNVLHLMSGG